MIVSRKTKNKVEYIAKVLTSLAALVTAIAALIQAVKWTEEKKVPTHLLFFFSEWYCLVCSLLVYNIPYSANLFNISIQFIIYLL